MLLTDQGKYCVNSRETVLSWYHNEIIGNSVRGGSSVRDLII